MTVQTATTATTLTTEEPVGIALGKSASPEETVTVAASKWRALVEFFDKQAGTPCEQVRHHDEVCNLQAHVAGNGSMSDHRIDEMSEAQAKDLLRYLAKDARARLGMDLDQCTAWVEAYADGRI